jgi:hypothetical protein
MRGLDDERGQLCTRCRLTKIPFARDVGISVAANSIASAIVFLLGRSPVCCTSRLLPSRVALIKTPIVWKRGDVRKAARQGTRTASAAARPAVPVRPASVLPRRPQPRPHRRSRGLPRRRRTP